MSPKYRAVPYRIYNGAQGELIHFDEHSLNLTDLSDLHLSVLAKFTEKKTRQAVLEEYGNDENIEGIIDELVELALVRKREPPTPLKDFRLKPNVRAFRIVLTEKCNLRCAECFVVKNADKLRTMSKATLQRIIMETIPYGKEERITYHFFGGEPLLRFDYIKEAVTLTEKAVSAGTMKSPRYTITTNATIVNDEIISFFKKYDFKVGVSVDGPEEINDQLRVYGNGKGSYRDVAQNYARLVEAGIDTHVLITPHPDHLDSLPVLFRQVLESFPMKTVTVNTPLHFDNVQWTVPGTYYAQLLIEVIRIAKEFGVSVDSAASPPLAALAGNIRREGPCALVCDTVMASIGPDGSMSFCSQKWHPFLTVPMTPDTKLATPIRRAADCLTCEARGICGGPCPAFQKISGGLLDGNKCDFMRSLLREAVANLDLFESPA